MNTSVYWFILFLLVSNFINGQHMRSLTPEEKRVIIDKGTEYPFTGIYTNHKEKGTYHCKQCDAPLYRSADKFDSGCGWPSFDDEIKGAVKRFKDADGRRTEIVCAACGAHLGHVFEGEGFTSKDTRHCVNSISLVFRKDQATTPAKTETAIFAGGCFWGVEHLLKRVDGVLSVESGYIGGKTPNPTYEEVCSHTTGHAEAVRVIFDPAKVTYEVLAKRFFEIHDPAQTDGVGPDLGPQYRSCIFYRNESQRQTAERVMQLLRNKGNEVNTLLLPEETFYIGEAYHQHYYEKTGGEPYCHVRTKKF